MAAQYRPYRDDDEALEGLDNASWSDHENGSIQIYEKTTETLRGPSRLFSVTATIVITVFAFTIGLAIGHYLVVDFTHESLSHAHHSDGAFDWHPSVNSDTEDASIKLKIIDNLDRQRISHTIEQFSTLNRISGSVGDEKFAHYIYDTFREYGLDVSGFKNFTFKTHTMPSDNYTTLELLDSKNVTLPPHKMDSYPFEDMRPFSLLSHARSQEIVTDQIMYVNRGAKEDYIKLADLYRSTGDMNITGKVLIMRQGANHTIHALEFAQEKEAAAVLLFPDPDVFGNKSPYPSTVQLPEDASLTSGPTASTNPETLGAISPSEATKLGLDLESRVNIPVIPISYNFARHILLGLSGPDSPKDWNCFDITLRLGPTYRHTDVTSERNKIRIRYNNVETNITGHNVIGVIRGSSEPDRYVIIGGRRDSLNRGVLDSLSGTAVILELARVFGQLISKGWRPRRSIVFISFGAESFNMAGTNDWIHHHRQILKSRAVAYINCDLIVIGNQTVSVAASPLLYQAVYNATRQVKNPNRDQSPSDITVYDSWIAHSSISKSNDAATSLEKALPDTDVDMTTETHDPNSQRFDGDISDLGHPGNVLKTYKESATHQTRPRMRNIDVQSLYSSLFMTCSIPVVDMRYTGFYNSRQGQNEMFDRFLPILNSNNDNVATMHQIDPDMQYHLTLARINGELIRDLADSIYIPFNLLDYAVILRDSFMNLSNRFKEQFTDSSIDLNQLGSAIRNFTAAAYHFHRNQDKVDPKDLLTIRRFNDQLMAVERAFSWTPSLTEHRHILLPTSGEDSQNSDGFPGLMESLTVLEGLQLDSAKEDLSIFIEIIKVHYATLVSTINSAVSIISDIDLL